MQAEVLAQAILSGLLWGAIFALIALGLTIIFGVMDIINFAHGEFLMVAMYITYVVNAFLKWDPLLALPLAAGGLYLVGLVVYRFVIKRVLDAPPVSQIVVTFGLAVFLKALAHFFFHADYRQVQNPIVEGRLEVLRHLHRYPTAGRGCRGTAHDGSAVLVHHPHRDRLGPAGRFTA